MKKSEAIKLMKEGTHFLVYDTTDRDSLIIEILSELGMNFSKSIPDYGLNGSINPINLSEIEPDNEKPYLFYEGEKYYFGEEYEFKWGDCDWVERMLSGFKKIEGEIVFYSNEDFVYECIRKIDHTTKYKKLLLELKEQAEKDGVNLKEML